MELGEIIKDLRKEKELNQSQLAKVLNTTQDTVSLWELGKSKPDVEQLKSIALFFDVTADFLLGLEDEDGYKKQKNNI